MACRRCGCQGMGGTRINGGWHTNPSGGDRRVAGDGVPVYRVRTRLRQDMTRAAQQGAKVSRTVGDRRRSAPDRRRHPGFG